MVVWVSFYQAAKLEPIYGGGEGPSSLSLAQSAWSYAILGALDDN